MMLPPPPLPFWSFVTFRKSVAQEQDVFDRMWLRARAVANPSLTQQFTAANQPRQPFLVRLHPLVSTQPQPACARGLYAGHAQSCGPRP